MKMRKEHKIELAKGVAEEIKNAEGFILASYKGLNFPQMDTIRRSIKANGNDFRVIKNTLLKKALNRIEIDSLDGYLKQSTAMVLVRRDFAAAAKSLKKYSKDFQTKDAQPLKIKAGVLDKKALNAAEVAAIADLPSREVLLAQVLATMNAPVQNCVSLLANIPRSFLNVLNAIKDNKAA